MTNEENGKGILEGLEKEVNKMRLRLLFLLAELKQKIEEGESLELLEDQYNQVLDLMKEARVTEEDIKRIKDSLEDN